MKTATPTLQEVDAYKVPSFLAKRISLIHKVPLDFAEGLIREAKRMLYLSIISDDTAPSGRVDWAWHEMLMFTKFYQEYCNFLGKFVHHVPNPPSEDMTEETWEHIQETLGIPREGSDTYNLTKKNYEKFFGQKPDPLFWP